MRGGSLTQYSFLVCFFGCGALHDAPEPIAGPHREAPAVDSVLLAAASPRGPCQEPTIHGALASGIFGDPVELVLDKGPWGGQLDPRPRLVDWDGDSHPDLMVAGGGVIAAHRSTGAATFGPAELVQTTSGMIAVAEWAQAVLRPMSGGPAPDLVVAEAGSDTVRIFTSLETIPPIFEAEPLTVRVNLPAVHRFDAADWDGDGMVDLLFGGFFGPIYWLRNTGTTQAPRFDEPLVALTEGLAYNIEPRVVDFGGGPRLLHGTNWGHVDLWPVDGGHQRLRFGRTEEAQLQDFTQNNVNLSFGDITRDGIVDAVFSGHNGRVYVAAGLSVDVPMGRLRTVAALDPNAFASSDLSQRSSSHAVAQISGAAILGVSVTENLEALISEFPEQLGACVLHSYPRGPIAWLRAAIWVALSESGPSDRAHWSRTADAIGLNNRAGDIMREQGLLLLDNGHASDAQLNLTHVFLTLIPRDVWHASFVTIADYLGHRGQVGLTSYRGGPNTFATPIGPNETSFPPDAPDRDRMDNYMAALAHEVNHTSLDRTWGTRSSTVWHERKLEGLARMVGAHLADADIVYRRPFRDGLDYDATRARFRDRGLWDGDDASWSTAWRAYFQQPRFERTHLRDLTQFLIEAPQEAFATLANQYFDSTEAMLKLAAARGEAGLLSNVDQFLLIFEYYNPSGHSARFYDFDPGGVVQLDEVEVARRAPDDRIVGLVVGGRRYSIERDAAGWTTGITVF